MAMRLAVIPARGGSKRIPRKNIRPFCGRPMIAWSIEAALRSGCFDQVLVSTDDAEIAALAKAEGASVPFMRPADLSDDHTGTIAVVAHAVQWHLDHGSAGHAPSQAPSQVCCLYATAPFVQPEHLQRGLALLQSSGARYAFSVTSYAFPIQRAIRITPTGRVAMFDTRQFNTRSQDLEEAFHDAGQFYWGQAQAWLGGLNLHNNGATLILPEWRVVDIDTPADWKRAEALCEVLSLHPMS